jgi:hypothetical protein
MLRALIREPRRTWTRAALARAAGAHEKGGVSKHVRVLLELGLLEPRPNGVGLNQRSRLARPVRQLLDALDSLDL